LFVEVPEMADSPKFKKDTVPVGATPVPKYASWDEHREAIRRAAEARRDEVERQRLQPAS
jgi:hypothetical protein